jgi:hypothetical protein
VVLVKPPSTSRHDLPKEKSANRAAPPSPTSPGAERPSPSMERHNGRPTTSEGEGIKHQENKELSGFALLALNPLEHQSLVVLQVLS